VDGDGGGEEAVGVVSLFGGGEVRLCGDMYGYEKGTEGKERRVFIAEHHLRLFR
jgi:hypothetical protein